MKKVYLYKGFERFWHWSQSLLIFLLMATGFEIHGSFEMFGYRNAVTYHNSAAWALIILIVFAIFWHITTGEWKQYIPTKNNLMAQMRYYLTGIFSNSPHPTGKKLLSKLNPLQRLVYFGLKVILIPLMLISGILYLFFHYPVAGFELESLAIVAILHSIGAYCLVAFVVVHLYLITTGKTVTSNLKAMVTGWEEMEEDEANEAVKDVVLSASKLIKDVSVNGKKRKKNSNEILINN